MLPTRRLGRTNIDATIMALGCSGIGAPWVDRVEAMRSVWLAIESGINLVDTSPHYGLGRSEVRVGQALRERPDLAERCYVSTKTGHYQRTKNHTYDITKRSVALSLERLQRDHVDIVHIHDPHTPEEMAVAMDGALPALLEFKEQGVIDNIGLGVKSLDNQRLAIESGAFDVILLPNEYDLLNQAGAEVIRKAHDADVGVIVAGVYATGLLVRGSADPGAKYLYRPAGPEMRARTKVLEDLADKWNCSLPGAAIQFCLRGANDKGIIALGARNARQIHSNIAGLNAEIPDGFWRDLEPFLGQPLPQELRRPPGARVQQPKPTEGKA